MTIVNPETGEIFEIPEHWIPEADTLTDEELVHAFADGKVLEQGIRDGQGKLEMELMRRATERGATTIYGKGQNFVIETKNEYDRTKLHGLLELFNPEGRDKCFTPAHLATVEVADKWDMQQVQKYAKARGNDALAIVEQATFPGKASGKLVKTDE